MRFYLSTFILVVLLCGALMAVVVRWDPWAKVGIPGHYPIFEPVKLLRESPDGTRVISMRRLLGSRDLNFTVDDVVTKESLFTFNTEQGYAAYFISDDEVLVEDGFSRVSDGSSLQMVQRYHRRHPEWWWGNFHRPEVWASIALFFSLVIHLVRARNQRNAGH